MIRRASTAVAVLCLAWMLALAPAGAQFADQATWAGTGAGSANAQTITVPNATSYGDLLGVILKYTPGAGPNTGDATLTVNGFGTSPHFRKPSTSGLVALSGGEIVIGQPVWTMFDGTYFDILGSTNSSLSIGATVPTEMTITGSPVTGNGTLGFGWNSASGNKVIASPANGSSGAYAGRALVGADIPYGPKAWVNFTVSGTTVTVQAQYNVSSVVRNSAGNYTVNFTNAMTSANYVALPMPYNSASNFTSVSALATGSVVVQTTISGGGPADCAICGVVIFGN